MDKNLSWFLKIHLQSILIFPARWTLKQKNIKYLKTLKNRLQRLNWIFETLTAVANLREVFVNGYLMNKKLFFFLKFLSISSWSTFNFSNPKQEKQSRNLNNLLHFNIIGWFCFKHLNSTYANMKKLCAYPLMQQQIFLHKAPMPLVEILGMVDSLAFAGISSVSDLLNSHRML